MKLEYISDHGLKTHQDDLIRLFDFTPHEVRAFQETISNQILLNKESVDVSSATFIQPINCSLKLRLGNTDQGIQRVGQVQFICELTEGSYRHMIDLVQPFADNASSGHQWLYDLSADVTAIEFLFSPNGKW